MSRKYLLTLIILLCLLLNFSIGHPFIAEAAESSQDVYRDGILAVVENQIITVSMVVRRTYPQEMAMSRNLSLEEYPQRVKELRESTLKKLIDNKLLIAEFEDRGYELPEGQISRQVDKIIRQESGGDRAEFKLMLRKEGLSMEEFREQVKQNMIVEAMIHEEARSASSRRVKAQEIREFYQSNREQFTIPIEVNIQRLFISNKDGQDKTFRDRINEVQGRLRRGQNLRLIGLEKSDRPEQLSFTWIKVDELEQPLQKMTKQLPLDKVSPPVRTEKGLYFIRIKEKKGERIQEFFEVRDTIEDLLIRQRNKKRYDELLKDLRRKFKVKIYQ